MRQLRWFVAVVLLLTTMAASAAFVLANDDPVRVDLPFLEPFYQRLWLVIAVAFFGGAFAASAGLLFQLGRKSLGARRLAKRVQGLEADVQQLRGASSSSAADGTAPPAKP